MALPLTVILLAGGASRRMGRDKALLRIRGQRAVDFLASHYAKLALGGVLVAAGRRRIPNLVFPQFPDPEGPRGPLAGLEAGLEASRYPWVLLVACDQDLLPAKLLTLLWRGRRRAKAVRLASNPMPGLYHRTLLPRIHRLRLQGKGPGALPSRMLKGGIPASWNTPRELSDWLRPPLPLE